MYIRVLGAAAGGGYPQWNCNHPNSRSARNKDPNARTAIKICVDVLIQSLLFLSASTSK